VLTDPPRAGRTGGSVENQSAQILNGGFRLDVATTP
jgi:hypothetical protein